MGLAVGTRELADREGALWLAAVALYGVGDTATTVVGLTSGRGAEAGPIAAGLIEAHGFPGLFVLKVVTFGAFYLLWRLVRTPGRVAIPLALLVVGAFVTTWNLLVLVR